MANYKELYNMVQTYTEGAFKKYVDSKIKEEDKLSDEYANHSKKQEEYFNKGKEDSKYFRMSDEERRKKYEALDKLKKHQRENESKIGAVPSDMKRGYELQSKYKGSADDIVKAPAAIKRKEIKELKDKWNEEHSGPKDSRNSETSYQRRMRLKYNGPRKTPKSGYLASGSGPDTLTKESVDDLKLEIFESCRFGEISSDERDVLLDLLNE